MYVERNIHGRAGQGGAGGDHGGLVAHQHQVVHDARVAEMQADAVEVDRALAAEHQVARDPQFGGEQVLALAESSRLTDIMALAREFLQKISRLMHSGGAEKFEEEKNRLERELLRRGKFHCFKI